MATSSRPPPSAEDQGHPAPRATRSCAPIAIAPLTEQGQAAGGVDEQRRHHCYVDRTPNAADVADTGGRCSGHSTPWRSSPAVAPSSRTRASHLGRNPRPRSLAVLPRHQDQPPIFQSLEQGAWRRSRPASAGPVRSIPGRERSLRPCKLRRGNSPISAVVPDVDQRGHGPPPAGDGRLRGDRAPRPRPWLRSPVREVPEHRDQLLLDRLRRGRPLTFHGQNTSGGTTSTEQPGGSTGISPRPARPLHRAD